jgi:heme ABC exporter ATP-binding subunit CcmA
MPSRDGVPLLEARGLQRSFGRARVLRGIDLTLNPGEAVVVIGPNGAGKTTLLRLVAGLLRPDAGEARVLGAAVRGAAEARRAVGFLSHASLLYDDLTLLENLVLAARLYALARPRELAAEALEAAGLLDRGNELPRKLSRGLLQRVALARALLHSPRLLLLDEPFSALDSTAADRLLGDLRARLSHGAGLLLVTHQLADVWSLATRVAVLVAGRWVAEEPRAGSPESFLARYQQMTHG